MGNQHTITIAGQLAYDPEMQYHESRGEAIAVTTFKIATNRKFRGEDETAWFRITVFGNQAESVAQWCKKGTTVQVVGRMNPDKETGNPRIWQNNNTGAYMTSYEVIAQNVTFLADLRSRDEQSVAHEFADEVGGQVIPSQDFFG